MTVTTTRLPLATTTWDDAERAAMQRVIESGYFTMGAEVRSFERAFADTVGARYAVMVNSGSSANLLAVAAAVLAPGVDLAPGDEVIVPAVSWSTTYYPLQQYGLRLRFVDVDPLTLNLDLDAVRAACGPATKAVMAVNLLGNPNDFAHLQAICTENDLVLFEDNCEALGATFEGRAAGTFGLLGTYSTFFSHHISTMEGGVVVTDDEVLHHYLLSLRAHGWTRDLPDVNHVHDKTGDPFEDSFRFVLPGYNVRPLELSGALGQEQLKKLDDIVAGRRRNAERVTEALGAQPGVRLQQEIGESSWFGFSLVLQGNLSGRRRDLVTALTANGIECRPIVAGNFTKNPVMAHLDAVWPASLPAAEEVDRDGLFFGNHHYDIADALPAVVDAVRTLS
ncbi:aminotransferase class V-fold PLP-dependent enzyme [Kineococcus sp. R8]|uniref:DegT/DnrJ/EryC1/StrS family aminotransferase n=1 Tax=Kineococcus siccus TaxID=2696567 RepID=UPI0014121F20|nr:DegT/DnrJ/EryC1/StrS family aminotransferase [Kineococcus siccus]NAZ83638.1 aminotransferase class V-fold PLP-dependent enzyme [Kineococcus siccus]